MTQTLTRPSNARIASSGVATTMRAAVVVEPGQVAVRQVPVPQPLPNEVLVKLEGCGVCASNIPPWEGRDWFKYPMAPGQLGHEGWGRIAALGTDVSAGSGLSIGQRVAFLSDHAYAEYDVTSQDKLVVLPDALANRPFPAEPLGCAMNIFARCGIRPGMTVAVIGAGFLGALLTRLAADANAKVIAVSRRPYSLEVARAMGAAQTILMDDHWRIIEQVRQATGGAFCDVVIEAVGKQWPLDLAAELTRERGRLIVAGYHQDGPRQINMQLWNWRGLDVINAHERDPSIYLSGMQKAVEMVSSGRLNPDPLYTHRFPLEKLSDAIAMTRDRPDGFLKALMMM